MKTKPSRIVGATLMEILVVGTIIAIIAGGCLHIIHGIKETMALSKLRTDVATINRAVSVYQVSGGSLENVTSPEELISVLRTRTDAASSEEQAGFSGRMIDPRIAPVLQTPAQASKPGPRAIWNADDLRLEIVQHGARGVTRFVFDEDLAATLPKVESRKTGMKLSANGEWIWDYSEGGPEASSEAETGTDAAASNGPGSPANPSALKAPVFSVSSGTFPATQFNLSLDLKNPNPQGVSRIVYTVNSGGWTVYKGDGISVSPESTISAYVEAIDMKWSNSAVAKERYKVKPVELAPPGIEVTGRQFDLDDHEVIVVSISNPNSAEVSMLECRVSGGTWVPYSEPFALHLDDNPIGAIIEARVVPTKLYFIDSDVAITSIDRPAADAVPAGRSVSSAR